MRVLGIDEAGRGCVLGPLVVGAFLVDDALRDDLHAAGARDSKRLSAKKRQIARAALSELGTEDVRRITAVEIDRGNLNTLEEAAIVDLVRTHRPDRVEMDALGHPRTLPALEKRLSEAVAQHGLTPTWYIAPKADHTHPPCGAASIVAKTTRDEAIEQLKATWGDFGSGYPSDSKDSVVALGTREVPIALASLRAHAMADGQRSRAAGPVSLSERRISSTA